MMNYSTNIYPWYFFFTTACLLEENSFNFMVTVQRVVLDIIVYKWHIKLFLSCAKRVEMEVLGCNVKFKSKMDEAEGFL